MFAPIGELVGFPPRFFAAATELGELHLFDRRDGCAPMERLGERHIAVGGLHEEFSHTRLHAVAEAVNSADLDLLVIVLSDREAHGLVELLNTPCIVNICTGSDLMHHDKLAFQVYSQPQADFFVVDHRLFSGITHRRFSSQFLYEGPVFYDNRGVAAAYAARWRDRQPLIFCHGSLYKLASPDFLSCMLTLLGDDSELELAFMGRDDGGALDFILGAARRAGLERRVHYDGNFHSSKIDRDEVAAEGWRRALGYLQRARLAPDPWPIGGGGSRYEAYAAGAPAVHLGVRFDRASWGRHQLSLLELPDLLVQVGTAGSLDEYVDLCRRCLSDEAFADDLITRQLGVVDRLDDPAVWWQRLLGFYRDWLETSGGSVAGEVRMSG